MVSVGDTEISLHRRPGPTSNLGGGGYSMEVKTQKLLSAKICLNLNYRMGEGGGER